MVLLYTLHVVCSSRTYTFSVVYFRDLKCTTEHYYFSNSSGSCLVPQCLEQWTLTHKGRLCQKGSRCKKKTCWSDPADPAPLITGRSRNSLSAPHYFTLTGSDKRTANFVCHCQLDLPKGEQNDFPIRCPHLILEQFQFHHNLPSFQAGVSVFQFYMHYIMGA